MIEIYLKTNGKDILDKYGEKDVTLVECALIIYRLEEIKLRLLDKEFDAKFEVKEDE